MDTSGIERPWLPSARPLGDSWLQTLANELEPPEQESPYARFQDDPVGFSREVLGTDATSGQRAILESVRDHRVTVVQSANGVGKTFIAADCALWFSKAFTPAHVQLVAAPPLENLEKLLWGEVSVRFRDHAELLPGRRTREQRVTHLLVQWSSEHWLRGRAIPQSARPESREARFGGVHGPHQLFIFDEGDAVPPEIYRATDSCMSGQHERLLILFNPRYPAGPVWNMIRNGQANVITLSAFDHPNVVTGQDRIPGAVSRARVVERISKWSRPLVEGEDQDESTFAVPDFLDGCFATRPDGLAYPPLVGGQARKITDPQLAYMVLGRFPTAMANALIDKAWLNAARARWILRRELHGDRPPEGIRPRTGQDVAEMGDDLNALCDRYGGWVANIETWAKVDVLESARRGVGHARAVKPEFHFVDANGVGAGVVPVMRAKGIRQAVPVKTQKAPTRQPEDLGGEFKIYRDQLCWALREWLRLDPTAMLPDDDELEDDLLSLTYEVKGGQVRVLPKDEIKKLLLRSPDKGDSLILTFAEPDPEEDMPMPMPAAPVRGAARPDRYQPERAFDNSLLVGEKPKAARERRPRKGGGRGLSGKIP